MSGDFDLSLSHSAPLGILQKITKGKHEQKSEGDCRKTGSGIRANAMATFLQVGLELQCVAVHSQLLNIGKAVRYQ